MNSKVMNEWTVSEFVLSECEKVFAVGHLGIALVENKIRERRHGMVNFLSQ